MKPVALFLALVCTCFFSCQSQTANTKPTDMALAANNFLQKLSSKQKEKVQFLFDDAERYHWHYVPMNRKGIALKELNNIQYDAAMNLLRTALSDTGFQKTTDIIKLEAILREIEGRTANDDYRDPGKYYLSIFGNPAIDSIWSWRLEGHHISFNFSSENNRLISGTPGFLGANPATVLNGPQKGMQVLKDETKLGFALLHSLDEAQKTKAIINQKAPAEIITGADRKAMINDTVGILFRELNSEQQRKFLQLLTIYLHRYKEPLASSMMHDIQAADINNLRFAWAGAEINAPGNGHYYRIQGPTIIIEYDNTQNNANHVHTVVRDLKRDFGGDELLEHYRKHKH